jgi:CheY-like chemotaxis protein
MPFGFHKKEEEEKRQRIITNITDKEDLDEIKKIAEMLNPNEEVFVVAKQSRLKPGGSHFTPNIVFATDRRIIISPTFYDLLLIDINLPDMNGFQFSQKVLEIDANVRVCFISAGEANIEALREVYPKINFGCFIKKPVSIEYLVKRLRAELD